MLLLVDKPKGMSSHGVVDHVRRSTGERKVGHGGTLDPNATGLLIIGVGRGSTKKLSEFNTQKDKVYEAEIVLGQERDTDDVEGEIIKESDYEPDLGRVNKILDKFEGEIEQIPPAYSAIKTRGEKAYELARAGRKPELKSRKVLIKKAHLISYNYPRLKVRFEVGSGTYIRALARDIGRELGSYGYLANLRRTQVGQYHVSEAKKLTEI